MTYFEKGFPKSLGIEDFEEWYFPTLDRFKIPIEDKLHTAGYHLCLIISNAIKKNNSVLITGGGVYNSFWIDTLKNEFKINCIIPKEKIIDYKEALIFAFLGLLKLENIENTYSSVTGASKNLKSGVIHHP